MTKEDNLNHSEVGAREAKTFVIRIKMWRNENNPNAAPGVGPEIDGSKLSLLAVTAGRG